MDLTLCYLPSATHALRLWVAFFCFSCVAVSAQVLEFDVISSTGGIIFSPGSVSEYSTVMFKCTYPAAIESRIITVFTKPKIADSAWTEQVNCLQNTAIGLADISVLANLTSKNQVTCDNGNLKILNLVVDSTSPRMYRCSHRFFVASDSISKDIILRTYKTPSDPVIQINPNGILKENEPVTYNCSSSGRPTPQLRFRLGQQVIASAEVTHVPSEESILLDGPESASMISWSTRATKDMNGASLTCEVYDHLSESTTSSDRDVSVYYGPDNTRGSREKSWNLEFSNSINIECDVDSNGDLAYQWFNNTAGTMLSFASGNLTLHIADYSYLTGDEEHIHNYTCRVTNTQNDGAFVEINTVLRIFKQEITTTVTTTTVSIATTTPAPITDPEPKTGSLEGWVIALIAVGAVVFIVIVVVLAVLINKRRNSPAQKKLKASRKGSDYKDKYGDEGASSPQPDIIRNNYRASDSTVPPLNTNQGYRYGEPIDDKPRSRKPIAFGYDNLELDGPYDGPPAMEGGPPAYHQHDTSLYRDYSSQDSYNMTHGAPC